MINRGAGVVAGAGIGPMPARHGRRQAQRLGRLAGSG